MMGNYATISLEMPVSRLSRTDAGRGEIYKSLQYLYKKN